MSEERTIEIHYYKKSAIRHFYENGEHWFCVEDFSDVLGYKNNTTIYKCCPKESRKTVSLFRLQRKARALFVPSEILFKFLNCVRVARRDEAKMLAQWVETLLSNRQPTTKQTQIDYGRPIPQTFSEALRALASEVEKNQRLTKQINENQKKLDDAKKFIKENRDYVLQVLSESVEFKLA